MAEAIIAAVASAAAGAAVSSAFSDDPVMPEPTKPTVMPTPDDEAVKAAKRRSIAGQIARRGRASTILSGDGETLGG